MKLWVLERTIGYEKTTVLGIYTSPENAQEALNELLLRPVYQKFTKAGDTIWRFGDVYLEILEVESDRPLFI